MEVCQFGIAPILGLSRNVPRGTFPVLGWFSKLFHVEHFPIWAGSQNCSTWNIRALQINDGTLQINCEPHSHFLRLRILLMIVDSCISNVLRCSRIRKRGFWR
jgi:hypothetical protein